jgi:hypothetical protein
MKADLIIHPTRLRIIQAFGGGQRFTARHVGALLPDIPHATLYRHLNTLVSAGILVVVAEHPARAIQERVYALAEGAANVGPTEYGAHSAEDHLRYFTTFLGLLQGDFKRYLQRHPDADVRVAGVAYYQLPLYLNDDEYQQLVATLQAALKPFLAHQPEGGGGRQRRLLSIIALPDAEAGPAQVPIDVPAEST